ncbi:type IV pilus modification PilV family protein [Demequina oxidasica]|uniref:type IV pilus modification PilV family protein n=1 Tax=Demequina oxidasica TaxID=676199 RepID=UPI000785D8D0|nr:prepilin-type N-terminal cleavage/methylation domain-containing protein [Demequina oxidasica]
MQDRVRRSLLSERDEGFTLVELIVAMLVMAIVLMAIIFIQGRALTTNADSGSRQQATTYANEAMEQMRSIPWNVLKRGMASNYLAAGSAVIGQSDPLVAGNTLTAEGVSVPLVVAAAGSNDQELSQPWAPLFDGTGSNIAIKFDPSGRGDEYVVKSYVTVDQAGNDAARGLAVVVEWTQRTNGEVSSTVLFSTAYAPSGGCGDLNNAPFLASCQALFYSASTSSNVVMSATSSVADDPDNPGTVPNRGNQLPLLPGSSFYSFEMSTSGVAARASSQQVSIVDSYVRYGGTLRDDNIVANRPQEKGWTNGYGSFTLRASDDLVTVGAAPPNPTDVTASASNSTETISAGAGVGMSMDARSDDRRQGNLDASVLQACNTGVGAATVPASNPCASAVLGASNVNSGYMSLNFGSESLRLGRVKHESGTSTETAWSGRFAPGVAGNSVTGCQVLSDAGCVSAGADRSIGDINVGAVITGSTSWDDGDAPQGLVTVSGYHDNVSAQRGSQQTSAAPTITRNATVSYWNGSGYSTISASVNQSVTRALGAATWTTPLASVTASGSVVVSPSSTTTEGTDPACKLTACAIDARNGSITVNVKYYVVPVDASIAPFDLSVSTMINGSQAAASYKEPEDNA